MNIPRITSRLAVTMLLVGALGACDETEAAATYTDVECPPDVEVALVPPHTCGEVTLPGGDRPELRLFVVRVEPPEPSDRAPVLETGTDVGMVPAYGGLAPIAQRTGRQLIIVDLAGTGHSTPSLACPEVDAVTATAASALDDIAILESIGTCRERLEEQGVDPEIGSPEALGNQLAEVVRVLGIDRVVPMGHGTTARAAVALTEQHPDLVEALVVDSLGVPLRDASVPVRALVHEVSRACRADPPCDDLFGDVNDLWRRATRRAATDPVTVRGVVVHEAELMRAVRWLVAPVPQGPTQLPDLLMEAATGRPGPQLTSYAAARSSGTALCAGYLPKCQGGPAPAVGAVLSAQCPQPSGTEWGAACAAWGMGATTDVPPPVRGVPALALIGRYSPFATPAQAREHLSQLLPDAHVVEDPLSGHNVLGTDCMREVRNGWLAQPTVAPPAPDCLTTDLTWP